MPSGRVSVLERGIFTQLRRFDLSARPGTWSQGQTSWRCPAAISNLHVQGSQALLELLGTGEDDSAHSQLPGRRDKGLHVINVDRFGSTRAASIEGAAIDAGMRLGESNGAGIDARGEEAEKREGGLLMRDMNRIGVGKRSESVMRGETREEFAGENGSRINGAVPDFAEPCEAGRHAEPRAEMRVPLARSDASFLPILPAGIGLDELH